MRGIYFVDPDDEEYKEILKNVRRKLERPMAQAMPCRRPLKSIRETCVNQVSAKPNSASEENSKTMFSCTVESHEFTSQLAESLQSENFEDHIAGKGFTSMSHYNLVHKFIPMPQAMKVPDSEAAVDKGWKKLETIPAWFWKKSRARRRKFRKHKEKKRKTTLPNWWTYRVFRWLGPFPAHDEDLWIRPSGPKRHSWAFRIGPSHGKCENKASGKMTVLGPFFHGWPCRANKGDCFKYFV